MTASSIASAAFAPAAAEDEPLLVPLPEPESPAEPLPNREEFGGIDTPAPTSGFDLSSVAWTELLGYGALALLATGLTAIAVTTLWWMLHAWKSEGNFRGTGFSTSPVPPRHSFTLLVPGRHEEEVMGQTLDRLAQQSHPDFEIIAIVGHDDPGTERVVREAAARHPELISVVVDDSVPKNKPKALNRALAVARGDVVGVFDAEDDVHPELLRLIDSRFSETGAAVVQGGVQLMNFQSSWWSLRNVLEYYFWFRSRLHFQAQAKFIPLGGNTVFITREWLQRMNGWDAECLAEDCELGVRLSTVGAKVVVAYSPEVVTREETPGTFTSLFKQRTRWMQGYMQVLNKKDWKRLPSTRQRLFARYILSMPFLQAATGLVIPISVLLIIFAKVPTALALFTFIPLAPTIITVAVEVAGLGEFGRIYGKKVRIRDYAKLVLGTFPYQMFLAAAAVRSVYRQLRGQNGWEKTEHSGLHRGADGEADMSAPIGRHSAAAPIFAEQASADAEASRELAVAGSGAKQ